MVALLAAHAMDSPPKPPFPTRQLFVLGLCRICEPIAFMSIFPYIYYMVLSFNITDDDRQIAMYAGLVTSAFTFAEFSTGVIWGRLSDRIGRKPVLIFGLVGTALSMIMFGFARSLPVAMLARAVGGLLNGNIGVLQTTVAELVTVKEHQPRAYTVMPFVWCLGSILGPAMGGALAQPAKMFPAYFPPGSLFDRFPFLLPNLICVGVLICGITIGILFLEETHQEKKGDDWGNKAGKWLLQRLSKPWTRSTEYKELKPEVQEETSLIDEEKIEYRTSESTFRACSTRSASPCPSEIEQPSPRMISRKFERRPSVERTFTKQVMLVILAYGILAYHTMTFDQLLPVFLSTPVSDEKPSLPFKFLGGFGLTSQKIGVMMAFQGAYSMFLQLLVVPHVIRRLGAARAFRAMACCFPILHFITPYTSLLPTRFQIPGVYAVLVFKITITVIAYPVNAIQLANAAPSLLVLGVINGAAASAASLGRALGPTFSGMIYSKGLQMKCSGLVWWVTSFIAILGIIETLWIKEGGGRFDDDNASDTTAVDTDIEDLALDTLPKENFDESVRQTNSTEHERLLPSA